MKRRTWPLIIAVVTGALVAACGPHSDHVVETGGDVRIPTFEVAAWPKVPKNWVLGAVSGIASDSRNHIWIIHRPRTVPVESLSQAAPAVLEFDQAGNFVQGWGGPEYTKSDEFEWPDTEHGLFVDHNDYVWIAGSGNKDHQILKFTRDGRFVMQIGRSGQSTGNSDTLNVNRAADVYVYSKTNELFVADGYGNRRIIVFNAETGAFMRMWGAYGRPPTDPAPNEVEYDRKYFSRVHGVRIANDGLVYVSDRGGMRLQIFTTDGEFLAEKPMGRYPDADPALVAARKNETTFGVSTAELIAATAAAHQSVSRTAFSADPGQKLLFVAERSNHQIVVLERNTLRELTRFGQHGDELGEFFVLHDMTTDLQGNIYTVEVNSIGGVRKRVQKFVLLSE